MVEMEFAQWRKKHGQLNPDHAIWWSSLPEESRTELKAAWQKALAHVRIEDALAVSEGLVSGRFEPMEGWQYNRDRQRTAAYVAKLAQSFRHPERMTIRPTRREDTFRCSYCRDTGLVDVYSCSSVKAISESMELRELLATLKELPRPTLMFEEGADTGNLRDQLSAILSGAHAVKPSPEHAEAVQAAKRHLRPASALCSCEVGDEAWEAQERRPPRENDKWRWNEGQRFDLSHHCLCQDGDVVRHAAKLVEWFDEQCGARSCANYSEALDGWNARD